MTVDNNPKSLGAVMRQARKEMGLTSWAAFAAAVGRSTETIYRWKARGELPNEDAARALANASGRVDFAAYVAPEPDGDTPVHGSAAVAAQLRAFRADLERIEGEIDRLLTALAVGQAEVLDALETIDSRLSALEQGSVARPRRETGAGLGA